MVFDEGPIFLDEKPIANGAPSLGTTLHGYLCDVLKLNLQFEKDQNCCLHEIMLQEKLPGCSEHKI